MVMFGRHFISNPDLVCRIKGGLKGGLQLSAYNRDGFYTVGSGVGYVDYPFSVEYLASASA